MTLLDRIERTIDLLYAAIPRQAPPRANIQQTKIAAHRGAHDAELGVIENTMAAFVRAQALGCHGIEFDVQVTADDVLLVHHDLDFKRIFNRDEKIPDIRWQDSQRNFPQVPTLEQVITTFGGKQKLFIEIKDSFHHEKPLVALLDHLEPVKDYYIISLDEARLAPLQVIPREAQLLIPVHDNVRQFCELVLQKNYGGVLGHYLFLTNRHVRAMTDADKLYGVGMIESRASLYREISRQIPWLFSNHVSGLMKWLSELKR